LDNNKLKEYLNLLRQFLVLSAHNKRQYIKKRAPDSCVTIFREFLSNILRGRIEKHNELASQLRVQYKCKRIIDTSVSTKEARFHLSEKHVISALSRLLPGVLSYLSSFENRTSNRKHKTNICPKCRK